MTIIEDIWHGILFKVSDIVTNVRTRASKFQPLKSSFPLQSLLPFNSQSSGSFVLTILRLSAEISS